MGLSGYLWIGPATTLSSYPEPVEGCGAAMDPAASWVRQAHHGDRDPGLPVGAARHTRQAGISVAGGKAAPQ
jgi:hypothetical protein